MSEPAAGGPQELVVCYDYHCPYSARVVRWLEGLGPTLARPTYRMFALEQVNVDPTAGTWRLWDQPLEYEHYRGRQDRRSLAAFLITAIVEEIAGPEAARLFRLAVYRARFDDGLDISDLVTLRSLGIEAAVAPDTLDAALADPGAWARARARLAEDWASARAEADVFGVPTLVLPGDRPVYLRLEREPSGAEAADLLRRLVDLRRAAPWLLELKLAEPHAG